MPTAVENLGENRVRLTVDVSPDQVKHAVDHAMSDLSESVKIPGFRQGKIPTQVLVSRLGKERIYAEAVDSHIGGWFWNAASRSRVRPVSDPQYEFELPGTAEEAWSFVATVEVQALPELADWTQLEVPRAEVEVPAEAVDAELEALRDSVAELAPADERPAQSGDTLVVDLVDADGEAQPDTVVELGGARLAPEIEAALIGAKAGETKHIAFPLADGSSSTVEITVREVQEKVLPGDRRRARTRRERVRHPRRAAREHRVDAPRAARRRDRRGVPDVGRRRARPRLASAAGNPARPHSRRRPLHRLRTLARAPRHLARDLPRRKRRAARRTSSGRWSSRPPSRSRASSRSKRWPRRQASRCSDDDVKAYIREEAEASGEADAEGVIEDIWMHGQQESIREDLRLRAALDRLVADVKPIAPDLAEARDKLWTPDKEKAEGETKLWTPGSKETA